MGYNQQNKLSLIRQVPASPGTEKVSTNNWRAIKQNKSFVRRRSSTQNVDDAQARALAAAAREAALAFGDSD